MEAVSRDWHKKTVEEVAAEVRTDGALGLTSDEAATRLAETGPNELPQAATRSPLQIFLGQFNDFMIWVLIAAALVSGVLLGELIDALAIGAILLLNALLGFVQEMKAEAAIESLREMAAPLATVVRNGQEDQVPAKELVSGDVVLLAAGDIVPADCRLIEEAVLQINEASLTGESLPVHKETEPIPLDRLALGDRKNMAYLGSTVQTGRGRGIVVATGSSTEMGKIAQLVGESREEPTPLQVELKKVGRLIAIVVLIIALVVFLAGIATGKQPELMFLAAVSLAVAAIPEGLPAIVTVTLALGVRVMAASKAIVRRLHAVETLGGTSFISTDKTGTLTKNIMSVRYLELPGKRVDVERGEIDRSPELLELLRAASFVNDAHRSDDRLIGDPTETALLEAGERAGIVKKELEKSYPRVDEVPFDSSRKLMTTLHPDDSRFVAYAKGAPEVLLRRCLLTEEQREKIERSVDDLAKSGYRTLAVAKRVFPERPRELTSQEKEFDFLGIVALLDPPREEVAAALRTCRKAGIRVAMVTGDHASTATAIGKEIGLTDSDEALTGQELEDISVDELAERLTTLSVFARVDPAHKVKIVEALKLRGEIVAMTGDGVNDAPALKKADIGVSMGVTGTEVAKEASDMVLADDNFATIVSAVRQGRLIFDNLRKFIYFLLSCNASEVLTMFAVTVVGLPIPLFPIQLLWTNLVTDGFPALALGVDPPAPDLMDRPPRGPEDAIVAPRRLVRVVLWGGILALGTVGTFLAVTLLHGAPLSGTADAVYPDAYASARTATFTAMVLQQLALSLSFRAGSRSIFSSAVFENRLLLLAVAGSALLQLIVVYTPALSDVFDVVPLTGADWAVVSAAIIVPVILVDIGKRLMPK
ncbi:MAG: cation-translocating P-type ATPase [Candidatus Aquicultorales bacterium]